MTTTTLDNQNAIIGVTDDILEGIHQKNKNIAVFKREINTFEEEFDQFLEKEFRLILKGQPAKILEDLHNFFEEHNFNAPYLLKDLQFLLNRFSQLTRSEAYRLTLASVSSNMCRKFHTDIIDLRLLCTYKGEGTLWIAEDDLSSNKNYKEEFDIDPSQIQQAMAGEVLILKGALYPEAVPVLHKSPSIEKDGSKRLLVRIDTQEFLNL